MEYRGVRLDITVLVPRGRTIQVEVVKPNPCSADTDEDGLRDGREVGGYRVSGLQGVFMTDPTVKDSDRDGLSDQVEVTGSANRKYGSRASNPVDWDTDQGGISDGRECRAGSDPTDIHSGPRDLQQPRRPTIG